MGRIITRKYLLLLFSHSVMSYSCDPMDYSLPGSSVHGNFQARILEWFAISFFRGSSWPRDPTGVSCTAGIFYRLSYQGSPNRKISQKERLRTAFSNMGSVNSGMSAFINPSLGGIWIISSKNSLQCLNSVRNGKRQSVALASDWLATIVACIFTVLCNFKALILL